MSLRIPSQRPDAPDPATCEVVLTVLRNRCGPIVDRSGLEAACEGDRALMRYSRDVLGMFTALGQVEHVRRDLWIIDELPASPEPAMVEEFLRAAVAARALGAWSVIDGR